MTQDQFSNMQFEEFEINGISALFTQQRVERTAIPQGLFAYDIRADDNGSPLATIEHLVGVNHTGTIITEQKIDLTENDYAVIENHNFIGHTTFEQWRTKKFEFYQDCKLTTWNRVYFTVLARNYEESISKLKPFQDEEIQDDHHITISYCENLYDCSEVISAKENGGGSSLELYSKNGNLIMDNKISLNTI